MFYSDDLLLGKKGSLGIVWLMATLGPRQRRVSRKDITNLEISRTCELIAQPPEPMALRLSGHLLVGVARVYNHTVNIVYDECQSLEAALTRPMMFSGGGAAAQAKRGGGVDLPGDGISRMDHITFPRVDIPDLVLDLDFEFAGIDWNNPLSNKRRRRATSKFSLQPSYTGSNNEVEEINSSEEETDLEDIQPDPEPNDMPLDDTTPIDLDLFDNLDVFNSGGTSGHTEANPSVDMVEYQPDIPEVNVPIDQQGGGSKRASPEPDVIEVVEPPKKKTKKVKTVAFDDSMEMDTQPGGGYQYGQNMLKQKQEMAQKKMELSAQMQANLLVDGWGLWLQFTDPDMAEFFTSITKAPKFKWELDIQAHKKGGRLQTEPPAPAPAPATNPLMVWPDEPLPDEPAPNPDVPNIQNTTQVEPIEDPFMVDVDNVVPEPVEIARRRTPQLQSTFPWDGISEAPWSPGDTPGAPFSTPGRSSLTPHERKLRELTSSRNRSRHGSPAGSIASVAPSELEKLQLIGGVDMPWVDDNNEELPTGAFSPRRLALIEFQCREFLIFVEREMENEGTDEIHLHELLPSGSGKRVAATAFHNCLALATKALLNLSQEEHHGPIAIRLASD